MQRKRRWVPAGLGLAVLAAVLGSAGVVVADTPSVEITIDAFMPPGYGYMWVLPSVSGAFDATGDIEDEGDVAGWLAWTSWWPPQTAWLLTLGGDDGTLNITLDVQTSVWTVTGGTGAYADATGGGTYTTTGSWTLFGTYYRWTLTGSLDVS